MKEVGLFALALLLSVIGPIARFYFGEDHSLSFFIPAGSSAGALVALWFAQQAWTQKWTGRPRISINVNPMKKIVTFRNEGTVPLGDFKVFPAHYSIVGHVQMGQHISDPNELKFELKPRIKEIKRFKAISGAARLDAGDEVSIDLKTDLDFTHDTRLDEFNTTQPFDVYVLRIVFFHGLRNQKYVSYRLLGADSKIPAFIEGEGASSANFYFERSVMQLRNQLFEHEMSHFRDVQQDIY